MRKIQSALLLSAMAMAQGAAAGGIVSNTNQHAAYQRNFAREATSEIDAAYSNPAGLTFKDDGLELAFSYQATFQERKVKSTSDAFAMNANSLGEASQNYTGEIKAPFIPSLQLAYKKNKWAFYTNIAVSGGGGGCKFPDGVPSIESTVASLPTVANSLLGGMNLFNSYSVESSMEGASYIFSLTLGASYKLDEHFSGSIGLRGNYALTKYQGYLRNIMVNNPFGVGMVKPGDLVEKMSAMIPAQTAQMVTALTADREIDCKQTGFGVSPILGVAIQFDKVRFGARYEFRTKIELENETKSDAGMEAYKDGVTLRSDVPAILATGFEFDLCKPLTLSLAYRHYFDDMATISAYDNGWYNKAKHTSRGTADYALGLEWKINDKWTVSATGMRTQYGVEDAFQSDLNFSLSCWSIGGGLKFSPAENIDINLAYFGVNYDDDYTKVYPANMATYSAGRTDVYNRTANSFAAGINYRFGKKAKSESAEAQEAVVAE